MKPKVLKKLEIEDTFPEITLIQGITDSEQWKQIEEVNVNRSYFSGIDIAPIFHLKRFDILFNMDSIKCMLELRDGISKSSYFERCTVRFTSGPSDEDIIKALVLKRHVYDNNEYFVYNIPNSTESLVFDFSIFNFFPRRILIRKCNCCVGF